MDNETNASASAFGWNFQVNASIYLMLKYFKNLDKLKVESNSEDIELILKNQRRIYAQAKSKQKPFENNNGHATTMKKALSTLNNKDFSITDKLIYINNLEPNPLNSNTDEFNGTTILEYNDLQEVSKRKVDAQLTSLNIAETFPKEKLVIIKLPFYGVDKEQRVKSIVTKTVDFISYTEELPIELAGRLLEIWTSEFFHNATIEDNKVFIDKKDIVWKMIILCIDSSQEHRFSSEYKVDEEIFQRAVEMYKNLINYKEGKFDLYNKIIKLHDRFRISNQYASIFEFINKHSEEIYKIIFDEKPTTDLAKITCSKIISYRIILRREAYKKIQRSADNYGD